MRQKRPLARPDRRLPSARAEPERRRPAPGLKVAESTAAARNPRIHHGTLTVPCIRAWVQAGLSCPSPAAKARSGFQFNQAGTGKAPSPSCSHRGAVQKHCARRASIECHQRRGERKRRMRRPCQIAAARHTHSGSQFCAGSEAHAEGLLRQFPQRSGGGLVRGPCRGSGRLTVDAVPAHE